MADPATTRFAAPGSAAEVEGGLVFQPRFDAQGLIPAIVTAAGSGEVLMFAWMNADALARTLDTGKAHFWSRSRGRLWLKGEESGNVMRVTEVRTDCDQDVIWLRAEVGGEGKTCHTGRTTCFYRAIPLGGDRVGAALVPIDPNDKFPVAQPDRLPTR